MCIGPSDQAVPVSPKARGSPVYIYPYSIIAEIRDAINLVGRLGK